MGGSSGRIDKPVYVIAKAEPESGLVPINITFSSTVIGGIAPFTYLWEFGDGAQSSEAAPTHQYLTEGPYQVKCTVVGADKTSGMSSLSVRPMVVTGMSATGVAIGEIVQRPTFSYVKLEGMVVTDTVNAIGENTVLNNDMAVVIDAVASPVESTVQNNDRGVVSDTPHDRVAESVTITNT